MSNAHWIYVSQGSWCGKTFASPRRFWRGHRDTGQVYGRSLCRRCESNWHEGQMVGNDGWPCVMRFHICHIPWVSRPIHCLWCSHRFDFILFENLHIDTQNLKWSSKYKLKLTCLFMFGSFRFGSVAVDIAKIPRDPQGEGQHCEVHPFSRAPSTLTCWMFWTIVNSIIALTLIVVSFSHILKHSMVFIYLAAHPPPWIISRSCVASVASRWKLVVNRGEFVAKHNRAPKGQQFKFVCLITVTEKHDEDDCDFQFHTLCYPVDVISYLSSHLFHLLSFQGLRSLIICFIFVWSCNT